MTTTLSALATHDEIVRCTNVLVEGACEEEFLRFVIIQEEMRQKWLASVQECQQLHSALEKARREADRLDNMLLRAKRLLDEEKRKRRVIEDQKNLLEQQITKAKDLLFNDGGKNINDETREKLLFLNNTTLLDRNSHIHHENRRFSDRLNTIAELNSTDSIMSDFNCFSKSEDDLDISVLEQSTRKRGWKEHRPSGEYCGRKRRSTLHKVADLNSSDKIIATTTVVVPKDGTITASSTIEAVAGDENVDTQNIILQPHKKRKSGDHRSKLVDTHANDIQIDTAPSAPKPEVRTSGSDTENAFKPSPNIGGYTLNTKSLRNHKFVEKNVKLEICTPCGKKIRFGKALKCKDCRATAHRKCKNLIALPCIPTGNTPTLRGTAGTIADYIPEIPPMVPSLIVHCINEVELRGMNEQGLYRVNGGLTEVKALKEKFLKGKGVPNLSDVDITTICSTLKDFLRSLREPLITVGLRADFARATTMQDKQDADAALYQAISELPQPNRDTLAFLILHLQRVSGSAECKMPISNLAKVFGPTLVGYSSQEPSPASILTETNSQVAIVESLLKIPSDYWANFVNPDHLNNVGTPKTMELRHTPSTESLLMRSTSRRFFDTPLSFSRPFMRRKFFATPPSKSGSGQI